MTSIARLRYRPFRLPMRAPMQTARAAIAYRAGVLVELTDDSGQRGYGEASPLPEFGEGDADDVFRRVEERGGDLLGGIPDDLDGPGAPALRCALDVAQLDMEGRQRGLPVAALLTEQPRSSVAANAVISDGPPEQALAQVREAWAAGFRTFKLKVAAKPPDDDVRRVQAIREALPNARLRLDANGGWDQPTATATLARLATFDIELVEQPVPVGADEALARIHRASSIRIAADEGVSSVEEGRRLLDAGAVGALVLKPMRLGGVRPALDLARDAAERGVPCIVTTTFDSGVGVAAALHLAAAIPGVDALPDAAHGLATAEHLAADIVVEPPRPADGELAVPALGGLGVEIDPGALNAAATGPWVAIDA
ncbi:MAG: o-succinylbenzoate synthase [Chloroflexi bacterium]|nr:o-succinylbenzoate synthase [Chloroflexota bacterium]